MKDKVSIWIGNFPSQAALDDYLDLVYYENVDFPVSVFTKDFEIDFYDNDFQEAYCTDEGKKSLKDLVEPLSYADTYINSLPESAEKTNTIIALYNFEYNNKVPETPQVRFIGVFDYEDDDM